MKITDEQSAVLASFQCERLKQYNNRALVKGIKAAHQSSLVEIFGSDQAWKDEQENSTAHYLIKTKENLVLAFFSIRCGELFIGVNDELLKFSDEVYRALKDVMDSDNPSQESKDKAQTLYREALNRGLFLDDILAYARKKQNYQNDVSYELSKEVNRVASIFSAIELNLLGVNEDAREYWKSLGLPQKMGETLFWSIIVPKLEGIINEVESKYLYLFAADNDPDGALVNYYRIRLRFIIPPNLGANKPHFDFQCQFMCQTITELTKFKDYFFEHFNSTTL